MCYQNDILVLLYVLNFEHMQKRCLNIIGWGSMSKTNFVGRAAQTSLYLDNKPACSGTP